MNTVINFSDELGITPGMIFVINPYTRNFREQILAFCLAFFAFVAAWNPCNNFLKLTRPFMYFVTDGGEFREIVSVDSATQLTIR